jgi:hypothetical protein
VVAGAGLILQWIDSGSIVLDEVQFGPNAIAPTHGWRAIDAAKDHQGDGAVSGASTAIRPPSTGAIVAAVGEWMVRRFDSGQWVWHHRVVHAAALLIHGETVSMIRTPLG